jgi:hypothetical protein
MFNDLSLEIIVFIVAQSASDKERLCRLPAGADEEFIDIAPRL